MLNLLNSQVGLVDGWYVRFRSYCCYRLDLIRPRFGFDLRGAPTNTQSAQKVRKSQTVRAASAKTRIARSYGSQELSEPEHLGFSQVDSPLNEKTKNRCDVRVAYPAQAAA